MIGAEYTQMVSEQFRKSCDRAGRVSGLAPPVGNAAAGGQGVGMVRPQYTQIVGEQSFKSRNSSSGVPRQAVPMGDVVSGDKCVGVISS